jgi:serine/threonine protein kinase
VQGSFPVGTVLDGRYRLVQMLRKGGMGEIYAGEHLGTHRKVAVKVLREPWSRDQVTRERFRREAQATSKCIQEHIVEILDFGVTSDGVCYLVMELLYGEDLQATLRREGRLPLRRAGLILLQICEGLAEAHRHRIIHRDLKPANIFRIGFKGVEDFIKLVDFGIAKQLPQEDESDGGSPLTAAGTVLGTVYYMPPEQATGGRVDHRADVYAVGVLLYQMVTGQLPFRGRSPEDTYRLILTTDAAPARKIVPELPAALDDLLRRAMHKNVDKRFGSMEEFAAALAPLLPPAQKDRSESSAIRVGATPPVPPPSVPPPPRRNLWLAVTVMVAAAVVTAAVIAFAECYAKG